MKIIKMKIERQWSSLILICMLWSFTSIYATNVKPDSVNSSIEKVEHNLLLCTGNKSLLSAQSASTVLGTRLLHRPVFQMEQLLDGTLPGLFVDLSQGYPTEKAGLRMRGRNLLIVVDGIPRSDANIPASQIESVTLIKDGLGLSGWGMSSGDGVLYIKTKRGELSKLKIDFTAQQATSQQVFRPRFVDAFTYANMLNEGRINDGDQPLYSATDIEKYKTNSSPYTHPNVDWYSELLRNNAPIQQYNLNISGGSASARYFIDLNYYDQQGFLKQDRNINAYNTSEQFKKYSLRTNVDIQLSANTLFAVNVFGQMFNENTPGRTMMGSIYNGLHTTPNNAYPITNPLSDLNGDGKMDRTYGGNINYTNNLYAQIMESGYMQYPKTDFNFDLVLEHQFTDKLKGFYVKALYSYNSSYREQLSRTKGFEIWNYKPIEGLDENATANYTKILSASLPNSSSGFNRQNRLQYIETSLGYKNKFGQHNLHSKVNYWGKEYILMSNNIALQKQGFNWHNVYNYSEKYVAEMSLSHMMMNYLSANKQWGVFPAAGVAWNIHNEDFFNTTHINSLQLKSNIGLNGNVGTGSFFRAGIGNLSNFYFPYIKLYGSGANVFVGQTNSQMNTLIESNIPYDPTYEKTRRFNIEMNAIAFDNALRAHVGFFSNYHYDMLIESVSKANNTMIGTGAQLENIGAFALNGVELDLTYTKHIGQIRLETSAHATISKTRLISNGEPIYPETYMQRVGKPVGQIFGYVADGFFQTNEEINTYLQTFSLDGYIPQPGDIKYRDLNGDNIIDGLDVKAIGKQSPRIEYGFFVELGWQNFALATQWVGLANVETVLIDMPFKINASNSYGQALDEHTNYWTTSNPTAKYPRISARGNSYNERASTFWLKDIGFLRLKNIELSYNLPRNALNIIGLKSAKVFVSGYNLFTFSKLDNRDPELLRYTTSSTGIVPNYKAYNAGVNIQF